MPTSKTKHTQIHKTEAAEPKITTYWLKQYDGDPHSPEGGVAEEEIILTAELYAALKEHLATISAPPPSTLDARKARFEHRAAVIREVFGCEVDASRLEVMDIAKTLLSRTYCDVNGPIEKFLTDLMHLYAWSEEEGRGLTLETVESELEDLRENMAEALSSARFIADRYKRPEVSDAK